LAPADLLQRQLAALIVKLLEPVEAVPAIPHHLAGLGDAAELRGQFQQPDLHANDLLLLGHVIVSVHAGGRAAVPALGENRVPPPRLLSGKTNNECQVKSELIHVGLPPAQRQGAGSSCCSSTSHSLILPS